MANKIYKKLKTAQKLGPSTITVKKENSDVSVEIGVTTEDITPLYTEGTEFVQNTNVTFGTTPVDGNYTGEVITFVCSVPLDEEIEAYLSDSREITDQSDERNALINGKELTGFVVNIHPNQTKGSANDINIINASCEVVPSRNYDTENNSYLAVTFTAYPGERDMDVIEDANFKLTLTEGGGLATGTELKYKVSSLDVARNETVPNTESAITPAGTTLSVTVDFNRVFAGQEYRIWKTEDSGTTWKYFDVVDDANVNTQSWIDDGTETFTEGTPATETTAKVYATVLYGQPLDDVTLLSAD